MYQTVGSNAVEYIAQALEKPLFRRPITGTAKLIGMEYEGDRTGDEVEDLYELVKEVKVWDNQCRINIRISRESLPELLCRPTKRRE
jgi:diphthamide synthase (EF-2-diphthine--ammonia ligase)